MSFPRKRESRACPRESGGTHRSFRSHSVCLGPERNWLCFADSVPSTFHLNHQTSDSALIGFVSHSGSPPSSFRTPHSALRTPHSPIPPPSPEPGPTHVPRLAIQLSRHCTNDHIPCQAKSRQHPTFSGNCALLPVISIRCKSLYGSYLVLTRSHKATKVRSADA